MKNIFVAFSYFSAVLIIASMALVAYWLFYPYEVLEFYEGNGTLLTETVKSGGYIQMHQVGEKKMDVQGIINRQFIDSIIYQIPTIYTNRPAEKYNRIEYIYIPKAIPPGEIYMVTTISFKVNPIRTIHYKVKTKVFKVTNGE